jgi:xylan 1,4-beta-xylosidase
VIRNPVLPGFHPDPSVIRVGEDYYLATSTFVWQPGIRLFHSRDLATWELVGHGLAPDIHDLRGLDANAGIWAPDLSYDASSGRFFLTYSLMHSTNAGYFDVDNYVVTATSIHGPWSPPSYLNSVGFDPSLFHAADGRHWLVTLEWDPREGYEHPGAILLDEFDPATTSLIGPSRRIYRGGTDRGCLEAPHLYEHDGAHYLMAAEGGTGYGHGVTLARSKQIEGPYLPDPTNPFLTSNPATILGRNNRDHLRPDLFNPAAELQKAGHGCLVDTPGGEWYVAHLCARPLGPALQCVLGRETALQQVHWSDDGWLRLSTGGKVAALETPSPGGEASDRGSSGAVRRSDFLGPDLDLWFSTLRRAATPEWLTVGADGPGLVLRGGESVTSRFASSVVATQLTDLTAVAETVVSVEPQHFSHSAGLLVCYDEQNFLYARVYFSQSLAGPAVAVVEVRNGEKRELLGDRQAVPVGPIRLRADIADGSVRFWWAPGDASSDVHPLGSALDATFMSDEAANGFMGTMVGLACVDSYRRDLLAHFASFEVRAGAAAHAPHRGGADD